MILFDEITNSNKLCSDGSEPLLKGTPCERCGSTDWQAYPEKLDMRCGGCGFWFIDALMEKLGITDSDLKLPLQLVAVIHHEIRDATGRVVASLSCEFDDAERRTSVAQARALAERLTTNAEKETQGD